ncbi:MAG: hypothetical protein IT521_15130 [Burkholderiales bacterium]|nr:hypothetical protein [Burkholderiales bacterium]
MAVSDLPLGFYRVALGRLAFGLRPVNAIRLLPGIIVITFTLNQRLRLSSYTLLLATGGKLVHDTLVH